MYRNNDGAFPELGIEVPRMTTCSFGISVSDSIEFHTFTNCMAARAWEVSNCPSAIRTHDLGDRRLHFKSDSSYIFLAEKILVPESGNFYVGFDLSGLDIFASPDKRSIFGSALNYCNERNIRIVEEGGYSFFYNPNKKIFAAVASIVRYSWPQIEY